MSRSTRLIESRPTPRLPVPSVRTSSSLRLSASPGSVDKRLPALLQTRLAPAAAADLKLPGLVRLAKQQAAMRRVPVLPAQRKFPMVIDFSQNDVRLPFGVPRFVNAATLRAMAGVEGRLLKNVEGAWEFVADEAVIDLNDRSVRFRLGRLTILS